MMGIDRNMSIDEWICGRYNPFGSSMEYRGSSCAPFCRYEIWGHRSPSYKKVCPSQKAAPQNDAAGAPHIPRWGLQKATRIFVLNAETRCTYD